MDSGNIPDGEDLAALHEQLTEARAEVERLQHEAATASARAQTAIVESAAAPQRPRGLRRRGRGGCGRGGRAEDAAR